MPYYFQHIHTYTLQLHESASNDKASQRLADELRRIKVIVLSNTPASMSTLVHFQDDLSKRDENERRSELERELKSLERLSIDLEYVKS